MKKKLFLLLPISLLLSGCLNVAMNNDHHEGGLFENGSKVDNSFKYEYYTGDSFKETAYTLHSLKMRTDVTTLAINNSDDLLNYMIDEDSILAGATEMKEIARNKKGLRVGDAKANLIGELTLNLNVNFRAVKVHAYPFSITRDTLENSEFLVDTDVALSVNKSKFIKLDSTVTDEEVTLQEASFLLDSQSTTFNLRVGSQRAVITQIDFYC